MNGFSYSNAIPSVQKKQISCLVILVLSIIGSKKKTLKIRTSLISG